MVADGDQFVVVGDQVFVVDDSSLQHFVRMFNLYIRQFMVR
jgi:hypothetical protein